MCKWAIQKNRWFGYEHINGTLHVKRFNQLSFEDAEESPFVLRIFGPWDCITRNDAELKLQEELAPYAA